ncbi:MAG TPA: cupredoxin domain-containing protein [Afifellaceae bacterium]|nr:cupredoxin domain-containing protein [Afifellaceae bacterium]
MSAHGENKHAAPMGQKGEPAKVTRTIEVTMTDNSYEPEEIAVGAGETVRFVIRNAGELVHEFNIGTRKRHLAHRGEMTMMIEMGVLEADRINHHKMGHGSGAMKHDDPNAVLLEPGETGEIVWAFPGEAKLQFACNVPGHYEDGMVGEFRFDGHAS